MRLRETFDHTSTRLFYHVMAIGRPGLANLTALVVPCSFTDTTSSYAH